jgi:hypothetical protein
MAGTKAVVKISAVSPDVEQDCIDCAAFALRELRLSEQTAIAQFVKRELDQKYGSLWHCVVGRQFGSYVSHDNGHFLYFFIDDCGFLIWRTCQNPSQTIQLYEGRVQR